MNNTTKFQITGLKETLDAFTVLANEIGDKKATSQILRPAIAEVLKPVLAKVKTDAPHGDTGLLSNSFIITVRRPTNKDKRSMYVSQTDTMIGVVNSLPIPAKLKTKFDEQNPEAVANFLATKKGTKANKLAYADLRRAKRKFYAQHNIAYDARVVAMEFGTSHVSARPYLRNALESQAHDVASNLGKILAEKIEKFNKRYFKKNWG